MSYREDQIIHEVGDHFVLDLGGGHYEVCRNGITHATVRAIIHYSNDPEKARRIAIERCNKLEEERQ